MMTKLMTTIRTTSLAGLLLVLLGPALATAQIQPWHFGGEVGIADLGVRGADESTQLQGSIGYDFLQRDWGVLTAEVVIGTAVSDGDIDRPEVFNADWDATTVGLFAAYRTPDAFFYPLARVGIQYADISVDARDVFSASGSDSDTGLAAGIGAGLRINDSIAVELSWTRSFVDVRLFPDLDLDVFALGVRF